MIRETLGNDALLSLHTTAFLSSRTITADLLQRCTRWADSAGRPDACIMSGFHSVLEREVLHCLLKQPHPVILALARGMRITWPPHIARRIRDGNLLVITPFPPDVRRITRATAAMRNAMMIHLADDIVVGYARPHGALTRQLMDAAPEKHIIHLA